MELSSKLQLAYYITIALTGLIGNTTTIFVFSQRRLRSLRSSFFLTCLAITDLIFILIIVIVVLDVLRLPVMTAPVCVSTIYLSHIASFLSSNFTLAYTSHRLVAVFFPMKATTFLKQRTNRILALALLIFASIFYSLSFAVTTTKVRSDNRTVDCQEDANNRILFPFLVLDTLFTFIVPFTLITCMNLAIVYKLQSNMTYLRKHPPTSSTTRSSTNSTGSSLTEGGQSSQLSKTKTGREDNAFVRSQNHSLLCVRPTNHHKDVPSRIESSAPRQRRTSSQQTNTPYRIRSTQCRANASAKTTKMLLAASTVFLVFNLPYHVLLFCLLLNPTHSDWMVNAVNMARLWFFASFCVNFFVYAICGQRFRNEVVRLFSCSVFRRVFDQRHQTKPQDRQNSIYLSHRLIQLSSLRLSQSN